MSVCRVFLTRYLLVLRIQVGTEVLGSDAVRNASSGYALDSREPDPLVEYRLVLPVLADHEVEP